VQVRRNGTSTTRHRREQQQRDETVRAARCLIGEEHVAQRALGFAGRFSAPVDAVSLERFGTSETKRPNPLLNRDDRSSARMRTSYRKGMAPDAYLSAVAPGAHPHNITTNHDAVKQR
jgi:hypothetical protein